MSKTDYTGVTGYAIARPLNPMSPEDVKRNVELFNRHITPVLDTVRHYIRLFAGKGDDEEYMYSVVLERLYRYIHTYDESRPLLPWVFVSVKRYVVHTACRFAEERHAHLDNFDGNVVRDGYVGSGSLFSDISDRMYRALMRLPEDDLRVFLRHVQGYTPEEISDMEVSDGRKRRRSMRTIQRVISDIRVALRKDLGGYGSDK